MSASSPQTNNVFSSAFVSTSSLEFHHAFLSPKFHYCSWPRLSFPHHSELWWNYPFESAYLFAFELLPVSHCLANELQTSTLAQPKLIDLFGFLLRLELFFLLDLLLQHVLESFEIFSLAHHPRSFLWSNVSSQLIFLLLLTKTDPIWY